MKKFILLDLPGTFYAGTEFLVLNSSNDKLYWHRKPVRDLKATSKSSKKQTQQMTPIMDYRIAG